MKIAPRSVRIAVGAWGRSVTICMVASRVGGSATSLCQSAGRYPLPMGSLFADAQNQGFIRRINIEPNDILNLLCEVGITQQLECLHQVRLEAMRLPNLVHRRRR